MVSGITLNAQKLYVQGGANFANITTNANGNTESSKSLTTFNAGMMARFNAATNVDIETGLLYTGRGSQTTTSFNNGNDYIRTTFNPMYLELPLNAVIKFPIEKNKNIFVHAGPYAAMGANGKTKTETKFGSLTTSSSTDIKFDNNNPLTSEQEGATYSTLKKFDYGFNMGTGFSINNMMIKLNYGVGLSKIRSMETDNNANNQNKYRTFSINLGFAL